MIAAAPAHPTGVFVWGQPARAQLVAGRPLGSTLAVFRSGKTVVLSAPRFGPSLAAVAKQMKGDPGSLELAKARRVGSLYLVPTTHGWVCVQGPRFLTCVRGLLRSGVTWMFRTTDTGIDVWGIAANDVSAVTLGSRAATLQHNVFFVSRVMKITSTSHLPKTWGTLTVSYRTGRVPVRVVIH